MYIEQMPLLTAVVFSAAALTVTLFVGWLGSRRDSYLLLWTIALVPVMFGTIFFGRNGEHYTSLNQFAAFALTSLGLTFAHAGAIRFRDKQSSVAPSFIMGTAFVIITGVPFLVGMDGFGTIAGNLVLAATLLMCASEYWTGRSEARLPMTLNAILYGVTAISFVLCAVAMIMTGNWTLKALPRNWAEDLNAVVVIIGLTGVGAISLTLNQFRSAGHHRQQAMTDALTGLLNRRALFDRNRAPMEPGSAVVMFDIDHFKTINDRLGHAEGDRVLEGFAALLRQELRSGDLSARLGGEEFCAVLPNLTHRSAGAVAERIRLVFETTSGAIGGLHTTVSAGVAISGPQGELFEDVLRRADEALYLAKAAGRNRVHAPGLRLVA